MPEGYGVGGDDNLPFFTPKNQVLNAEPSRNNYDNPRIFLKSILKPLKGLEVAFEYTFDKNMYDYHYYTSSVTFTTIQGGANTSPTNDYLRKYKQFTNYNAINAYATYGFDLGTDHHFKVMAGFNQESSYKETVDNYSYNQAVIEVPSLGGGTGRLTSNDYYTEYAVRGGFFRVNYNYKDKYLLEVNGLQLQGQVPAGGERPLRRLVALPQGRSLRFLPLRFRRLEHHGREVHGKHPQLAEPTEDPRLLRSDRQPEHRGICLHPVDDHQQ